MYADDEHVGKVEKAGNSLAYVLRFPLERVEGFEENIHISDIGNKSIQGDACKGLQLNKA